MVGKTMDPQIHVLIPGNYVTFDGKRGFAEIKKILSYGDNTGLSGWVQFNQKGPYKKVVDKNVRSRKEYVEM